MICKSESARIEKSTSFYILECFSEFDDLLYIFSSTNPSKINAKQMEIQLEQKITEILKYFEKNAYGNKFQKKKELKEKMNEKIEQLKKKMSR